MLVDSKPRMYRRNEFYSISFYIFIVFLQIQLKRSTDVVTPVEGLLSRDLIKRNGRTTSCEPTIENCSSGVLSFGRVNELYLEGRVDL